MKVADNSSIKKNLPHSVLKLNLTFDVPNNMGLSFLDSWLIDALGIEAASIPGQSVDAQRSHPARASDLLLRILALCRLFLQLGRLPVFDQPKILSLERRGSGAPGYVASVQFPVIEHTPISCYQLALKSALDVCLWAGQNQPSQEGRQKLFASIEQKIIKPLRRMVPAGKSTLPVLRVAHSLGIPFIHLGLGVYQLGWGSKARRLDRSTTEQDSAIGSRLSQNKVTTASLLRLAGFPAPVHAVVGTETRAIAAAQKIGFPVVVKPSDRDRGEGVAVDVADDLALRTAFVLARNLARNKQVIVERQVVGVCHRLFIANGKLLYGVKRLPMSVKGDGRHTVAQLVDAAVKIQHGKPPWNRSEIRPIDDMAIAAMRIAGFDPQSIPNDGALVPLRRIESTEWGGIDEDVADRIHPENLAVAIRAAELFGLHMAGIDIITPDISVPWYDNGAIINEVNFAPLLGGGEISRRHIPIFLNEFIQKDGKIPLEAFDGSEAAAAANNRHKELTSQGVRCYLTTASRTIDPHGKEVKLTFTSLARRIQALICRADVDAIVIASGAPDQKPGE